LPKPKKDWVKVIINEKGYKKVSCILIGDTINDWEATKEDGIRFYGYNNPVFKNNSTYWFKRKIDYFQSAFNSQEK
jgi:histidinol phosphatase-like enzyme